MIEAFPKQWSMSTVENLAGVGGVATDGDWIETKDQDPNGEVRLVQLADVGDGRFLDRSSRFMTLEAAKRLKCTFLQPGDLLIARMPDPIGRACIFPGLDRPAVTAVDVFIWRPGKIAANASWLMHVLNSPEVRNSLAMLAGGTTRQRVSGGNLKRLKLPVPPPAEQRRIVARIEALLARTRRARADLERSLFLAERFRCTTLVATFGSEEAYNWPSTRLVDLISDARIGLVRSKTDQSETHGLPYIRMQHYDLFGRWKLEKISFVKATTAEASLYELKTDDVLFNTRNSGELVGKVAIWPKQKLGFVYNNNLLRLRFRSGTFSGFMRWFLTYSSFAGDLNAAKSATTSVAAIYQRDLMNLMVPKLNEAEQQRVASRLSAQVVRADIAERQSTLALALLDRLEQGILARAYRGELVTQEPNAADVKQEAALSLSRGRVLSRRAC